MAFSLSFRFGQPELVHRPIDATSVATMSDVRCAVHAALPVLLRVLRRLRCRPQSLSSLLCFNLFVAAVAGGVFCQREICVVAPWACVVLTCTVVLVGQTPTSWLSPVAHTVFVPRACVCPAYWAALLFVIFLQPVTIRSNHLIKNVLLKRRQFSFEILHPGKPNVSTADVKARLCSCCVAGPAYCDVESAWWCFRCESKPCGFQRGYGPCARFFVPLVAL